MSAPQARTHTKKTHAFTAVGTPVSAIMSKDVFTVKSGMSLDGVAEMMLERGLSRIPVVNERRELIGMISKTDLVEKAHEAGDTGEAVREKDAVGGGFHLHAEEPTVDDVMSRSVVGVGDDASIQRAAELMLGQHVHGLPVVTRSGELIGFISTMDILGWLAGIR